MVVISDYFRYRATHGWWRTCRGCWPSTGAAASPCCCRRCVFPTVLVPNAALQCQCSSQGCYLTIMQASVEV